MKHFLGKRCLVVLLFLNELSIAVENHSKFKTRRHFARRTKFIDNFIGLADLSNVHSGHEVQKRTSIVDGGVFVPHKSTTIVYKSRLVPVTYGFVIKKETLEDYPALLRLGVKMIDKARSTDKGHLKPKSICSKESKVLLKLLNNLSEDIIKIKKKLLPEEEHHESGHKGKMEKTLNLKKTTKKHFPKARYLYCKRHKKQCSLILKRRRHNGLKHETLTTHGNGTKRLRKNRLRKKSLRKKSLRKKRLRKKRLRKKSLRKKRLRKKSLRKKRLRGKKGHCARCKVQVKRHRFRGNHHHQRTNNWQGHSTPRARKSRKS